MVKKVFNYYLVLVLELLFLFVVGLFLFFLYLKIDLFLSRCLGYKISLRRKTYRQDYRMLVYLKKVFRKAFRPILFIPKNNFLRIERRRLNKCFYISSFFY